jgi:ring-1,2-phenylacetyl-CoA epoxidase subunit PaaB
VHAPDAQMALRNARDLYTRRQEGVSIWVVPSSAITASSPDEKGPFFAPAADKAYRHPTFYDIPSEVQNL